MKEFVVDFRIVQTRQAPLTINGAAVERVRSTKFLIVQLTENLFWTDNTASLAKSTAASLLPPQTEKSQSHDPPIMCTFYRGIIESIKNI